jgi:hypothetical protein
LFSSDFSEEDIFQAVLLNPILLQHIPLNQMTPNLMNLIVDLLFSSQEHLNIAINDENEHRRQFFDILIQHQPKAIFLLAQSSIDDQTLLAKLNDLDFIKAGLRKEITLWRYLPHHLQVDPSLVAFYKQLYMSDPIHLQNFHQADLVLRDDLEVANWAISHDAEHYICLSPHLKDSETLLRTVIQTHPYLFEYASARLKMHQELAQIVFHAYPESYRFMAKSLIANNEFIINLIVSCYDQQCRKFSFHPFWKIILKVWKLDYVNILKHHIVQILFIRYRIDLIQQYLPKDAKNHRDIVKELLKQQHHFNLKAFANHYKKDKEMVIFALCCSEENFDYISADLKNDPDVLATFLRRIDVAEIKRVKYCLHSISQKTINHRSVLKVISQKWPNEALVQTKNVDDYLLQKIIQYKAKNQKR